MIHFLVRWPLTVAGRCGPMTAQACGGKVTNGRTVRLAVSVTPLNEAEIVAAFEHSTGLVLTVKVALVNPGDTVMLDGTVATEVLLLESATTAPPADAGPVRVTVPVEELPPVVLDGFNVSEVRTGGSTVIVAVCVTPPNAAVITAVVADATGVVVTVNVALVVPSGIVTVAGTLTDGSPMDNEITAPPVGAGPFIVTVPVDELPPVTSAGLKPSADSETTMPRLKKMPHLKVLGL